MRNSSKKNLLSLLLCMVLTAALALTVCGCSDNNTANDTNSPAPSQSESANGATVLGEGQTVFTLTVVDGEGNEAHYEIHTDASTVGEALLALELIEGEDGPYGLYIKTVAGITVDYDAGGSYWAFYVDGAYAMSGVDTTDITPGSVYTLKVES